MTMLSWLLASSIGIYRLDHRAPVPIGQQRDRKAQLAQRLCHIGGIVDRIP
jgi:hypothetical protein